MDADVFQQEQVPSLPLWYNRTMLLLVNRDQLEWIETYALTGGLTPYMFEDGLYYELFLDDIPTEESLYIVNLLPAHVQQMEQACLRTLQSFGAYFDTRKRTEMLLTGLQDRSLEIAVARAEAAST